jgi:hydrogenase-4 membrane subunit HyfE
MNKPEMLSEQRISASIKKRAISAVVLAFVFLVCCCSANWWDYIGVWSFVLVPIILSLLFWMFYLSIFEVALLIRDRRLLTKFHFIPIAIVSIYWILVIIGFFMIFEPSPLSEYDPKLTE